ncbi:glycosyltransferase [Flavobacterium sp. H122]|uniref:glycosyltransferase family 2 protein n=1 Tax=Flavobacterium sp. H122 TaxID=2529860 RepID=UPI0010AAEA34|nr:glycosyltransferase [Flavobacterium sp. H122]
MIISNSLVSVIIPVYNRSQIVCETLNSVLSQTYNNWECIIVDDGSTDTTVEVIKNFIIEESRFLLIIRSEDEKKGASTCRNIGLKYAKGTFIQFLDSDDVLSPHKILEQCKLLDSQSEMSFAFCKWGRFTHSINDAVLFDKLAVYKDFSNPVKLLDALTLSKGYLPLHSFLFSKRLIDQAGFWDENIGLNDDGEFFSRIILSFENAFFVPDCFVLYRTPFNVEDNLSSFKNDKDVLSAIKSWEVIFKRYDKKFRGTEKKYRIFIKIGVHQNTKKISPGLLIHPFFSELEFYFLKQKVIRFLQKLIKIIYGNG